MFPNRFNQRTLCELFKKFLADPATAPKQSPTRTGSRTFRNEPFGRSRDVPWFTVSCKKPGKSAVGRPRRYARARHAVGRQTDHRILLLPPRSPTAIFWWQTATVTSSHPRRRSRDSINLWRNSNSWGWSGHTLPAQASDHCLRIHASVCARP